MRMAGNYINDDNEDNGSFDEIRRVDGGGSMFSSQNNTMIERRGTG